MMLSTEKYTEQIRALRDPSFQKIRSVACRVLGGLSEVEKEALFHSLDRGVALLDTHEQLCQYLYSYGNMHEKKIHIALDNLHLEAGKKSVQIIDWGCGQGLATVCFFDWLKKQCRGANVSRVVLIEPSRIALERAELHVDAFIDAHKVVTFNSYTNDITAKDIVSDADVTIHFFSNVLDIDSVDVRQLARTIADAISGEHYFVCVGPLNAGNQRIDAFYNWFQNPELIWSDSHNKEKHPFTARYKIFKIERYETENILVSYNPPKQFHAAYRLDCVKKKLTWIGFAAIVLIIIYIILRFI